ncbi:MAG: glycoside hydrolase family 5 protein [Chloroflexota bacterium]|jgi:endoglucanase
MKKTKRTGLMVTAVLLFVVCGILALAAPRFGNLSITLPVEHKPVFDGETSLYPGRLNANDNYLVDANGDVVTLHGIMPPDPAVLSRNGRFNRAFFDRMAASGANVIRIPVHPERWERDPDYLWRYLDPAVAWNGENGLYTIIDLHFIGDIGTDRGAQMPDIQTPSRDFAIAFWQQVAVYFKDTPHVIFEIFNEPAEVSAEAWQTHAQALVDTIRATGAKQLIIVGGIEYSRDLSWVLDRPIHDDNIAYAAHIYPAHSRYSWNHWFGSVSEKYPVVMTEWGWLETDPGGKQPYLVGNQKTYGEPLLEYLEQHGIGWVACWYDDEWKPAMFEDGIEQYTPFGQFVMQELPGQ